MMLEFCCIISTCVQWSYTMTYPPPPPIHPYASYLPYPPDPNCYIRALFSLSMSTAVQPRAATTNMLTAMRRNTSGVPNGKGRRRLMDHAKITEAADGPMAFPSDPTVMDNPLISPRRLGSTALLIARAMLTNI